MYVQKYNTFTIFHCEYRLHGGMFMNLNNITKINKNLKKKEKKKRKIPGSSDK